MGGEVVEVGGEQGAEVGAGGVDAVALGAGVLERAGPVSRLVAPVPDEPIQPAAGPEVFGPARQGARVHAAGVGEAGEPGAGQEGVRAAVEQRSVEPVEPGPVLVAGRAVGDVGDGDPPVEPEGRVEDVELLHPGVRLPDGVAAPQIVAPELLHAGAVPAHGEVAGEGGGGGEVEVPDLETHGQGGEEPHRPPGRRRVPRYQPEGIPRRTWTSIQAVRFSPARTSAGKAFRVSPQ